MDLDTEKNFNLIFNFNIINIINICFIFFYFTGEFVKDSIYFN